MHYWVVMHNTDWWSGGRGFDPCQVQQYYFLETDHEILHVVIPSLLLIHEVQLSLSGERIGTSTGLILYSG